MRLHSWTIAHLRAILGHETCGASLDSADLPLHSAGMSPLRFPLLSSVFKCTPPALVCVGCWLFACGGEQAGGQTGDEWVSKTKELRSEKTRLSAQGSPNNSAAAGERGFAWDVFRAATKPELNNVLSPLSLSLVGAMLDVGTEGETQSEIRSAFHFGDGVALHPDNNTLLQTLAARNHAAAGDRSGQVLKLSQDAWMQEGAKPAQDYLDSLAQHYGIGAYVTDYESNPEAARQAINSKVSQDTSKLIKELLKPGIITPQTRLVLTNAMHLKLNWVHNTFRKEGTTPAPFYGVTATRDVPMMHGFVEYGSYAEDELFEAAGIPTEYGELQFVALLPKTQSLAEALETATTKQIEALIAGLGATPLAIELPSADLRVTTDAKQVLTQLGVESAFQPSSDFFPMFGSKDEYFVSAMPHEAVIHWDENGLEAAAATAAVVSGKDSLGPEPKHISLDHPFVFLVRDLESDTVLFVGQLVQPE
jgi:serpin B